MRKRFTNQFKAETAIELLQGDKTIGQIASERKVAPTQLSQWRAIVLKGLPRLFDDQERALDKLRAEHEAEREKLYAEIGRLTSELNWLKKRWPQS
jgi:transposase-like protein